MNFKPHHVALTVNNIDESIKWYESKLGFSTSFRRDKNGMDLAILELEDVRIELFNFEDQTKPLPKFNKDLMQDLHMVGTKHLCLQVDDLEEAITKLKEKGVEFVTEIDTAAFGGRYIFFKDCNDILIELYQE